MNPALRSFDELRRVRPWTRWDVRTDLGADVLRLFTIQARPAYDALVASGVHRQSEQYADADFSPAYRWISEQMAQRLPSRTNGPPIWLWARRPWRELRHDVRRRTDEESVLLEVHLPHHEALLSHFDDWHLVLNRGLHVPPLLNELTDHDAWWARAEPLLNDFDDRADAAGVPVSRELDSFPPDLRHELETSWTGIFDPATWGPRSAIQATTPELRAEHVVRALRCP